MPYITHSSSSGGSVDLFFGFAVLGGIFLYGALVIAVLVVFARYGDRIMAYFKSFFSHHKINRKS